MQLPDKHEDTTTKAFAGLRVLDFSTTIAGPHCARMLADMGAEVIKIETDGGETMRTRPPLRKGCSTVFGQLNVGKKSVVLDLKSEHGKEAVRRLVATATPGATIAVLGEHTDALRDEISLANAASIPSGKTAVQG